MSFSQAGRALTESHRLAQARLARRTVAEVLALWAVLDVDNLDATVEQWLALTTELITRRNRTSAELAAEYVSTFRLTELEGSQPVTVAPSPPRPLDAVRTSLLLVGPARIRRAFGDEGAVARAITVARAETAREATRHTLAGGRATIIDSVNRDPSALGWARATSGSPCHFCAMIASRGPVFGSSSAADFPAHAGCNCTAEPVYREDASWPPGAARYREQWEQAGDRASAEGIDQTVAFRRMIENR